jgi:hypothetical protein
VSAGPTRRQVIAKCGLMLAGAVAGGGTVPTERTALRVAIAETPLTCTWTTRVWGYSRSATPV